jgi:phosphonoacetaldehyde hydrolase
MVDNRIAAVVFDWAGTVVDFGSRAPVASFVELFARHGVVVSDAEAREPMGLPKRDHVAALGAMPSVAARWRARHGRDWEPADVDRLYAQYVPINAEVVADHVDLVPGTVELVQWLRGRGIRVGSNTGYVREIMQRVVPLAAQRGFAPDNLVCADDLPRTRPTPLAMYRSFVELGVWPASRVVKVDDTVPGLLEGRHAGCWTVGVLASGNEVGLSWDQWQALDAGQRARALDRARSALSVARPDALVETVADLPAVIEALEARLAAGERPADPG